MSGPANHPEASTGCPHPTAGPGGQRRAVRPGEVIAGPAVELREGLWLLRDHRLAQQLLRARHQTRQAGFTAEHIPRGRMRQRPILIDDGPGHDAQRRAVARFFAPTVVAERHLALMERSADQLVERARRTGNLLLDEAALFYTVEVTAEIVGLTHQRRGDTDARRRRRTEAMARRLESFFNQPPFDLTRADLGRTPWQWLQAAVNGLVPLTRFALCDVAPAVRQRRRGSTDDVMGHLVQQGHSWPTLLVEAVTYGTAGMVTTREFICMAAWHLLDDPSLRSRYLQAPREERHAILEELIRLEPVVGHLYRRATERVQLGDNPDEVEIPAGGLVDIDVRAANADPAAVGEQPLRLCPGRQTARGVRASGLSFGDGAHRCPGQHLAIWETDVLLTRLLALDARLVKPPELSWDDLVAGYQLRRMRLEIGRRGLSEAD